MVELLWLLHWVVYFLTVAAVVVIILGDRGFWWRISVFYLGGFLILQGIRNGCVLTDLQNYFRLKEGLLPLENTFIFSYFIPNNLILLSRIMFICLGILYWKEIIKINCKKNG
jgi:hypothetical protein